MKRFSLKSLVGTLLFLSCTTLMADPCDFDCCYPCATDAYCNSCIPQTRSDNIPLTHVAFADDEFLSGYVQALVDMSYYEFQVRIIVKDRIAYVFNLPNNELISQSILCFICDIPCIVAVESMGCTCDEFVTLLEQCDDVREDWNVECVALLCEMPLPYCQTTGIWFPQSNVLFAPLVADPRQVMNSAGLRFNDNVIGKHVGAVSLGDEFAFYRWKDVLFWQGDLQLGVEAGIWAVFDLDHPEACLVNTDFFVAASFTYAYDRWSYRFRLWHLSSHLGDEFLIANPHCDRKNASNNGVDFFASFQLNRALRLYAGIGDIFSHDKSFHVKPIYIDYGVEIRVFGIRDCYHKLYIQPFLAMNFRNWQENDWDLDANYALGLEYSKIQGIGRKFRIFAEYHQGFSEEGQFIKERTNYFAIRIAYGF